MNEAPSAEDLAEMGLDSNKFDINPAARRKVKPKRSKREHAPSAPKSNINEPKPVRPPNSIKKDINAKVEASEGKRDHHVSLIVESIKVSEIEEKDFFSQKQKI